MNQELMKVALRQRALYLPVAGKGAVALKAGTLALVAELRELGFAVAEELLHALNALSDDEQRQVADVIEQVMGTGLNWAALVKGWLEPTGESAWDHFLTLVANAVKDHVEIAGTTLPCGHLIPMGTFPLERYTGCPFCGKPFVTASHVHRGQGTKLRLLQLWGDGEMQTLTNDLLLSPVPLDATQRESLKALLHSGRFACHRPLCDITQKETRMLVADWLVEEGRDVEAAPLFDSPADVMRYLWYRHTGHLQLLEPRTLLYNKGKNQRYEHNTADDVAAVVAQRRQALKLKYSRQWCRRVASWLNALPMAVDLQLEVMHPKRQMWVRFIRALRLYEYAGRPGYEQLAVLLDRFYRRDYVVWQGVVDHYRLKADGGQTLRLLQQRPGLFARCLFSSMLHFGPDAVVDAFRQVMDRVPVRLLLSLTAQAQIYFDRNGQRVARPLGGVMKPIGPHALLDNYTDDQLQQMQQAVGKVFIDAMRHHFSQQKPLRASTVYIDPQLDHIPVAVGDRSNTVGDVSAALQGTRFPVAGDSVRLFLHWGRGLPAQHLDMDLSAYILTDTTTDECAYFRLTAPGARHSGDMQAIPDQVGTAEYIELSLPELQQHGARQVVFTCNAYTAGELVPELLVGWMSTEHPMTVDADDGVAYDPSTVDHMVRITQQNLAKGLVFGVLNVERREITWLEMPFDGQTVLTVSPQTVGAYLRKLQQKPTIGQLLRIRAEVLGQTIVDRPGEAGEACTLQWAQNTAQVSRLLMG